MTNISSVSLISGKQSNTGSAYLALFVSIVISLTSSSIRTLFKSGCKVPEKDYPDMLDYEMFGWEDRRNKDGETTTLEQRTEAKKLDEVAIVKYEIPEFDESNRIGKAMF